MTTTQQTIAQITKATGSEPSLLGEGSGVTTYEFRKVGRTLMASFKNDRVSELFFWKNATDSKKVGSVSNAIALLNDDAFYGIS